MLLDICEDTLLPEKKLRRIAKIDIFICVFFLCQKMILLLVIIFDVIIIDEIMQEAFVHSNLIAALTVIQIDMRLELVQVIELF